MREANSSATRQTSKELNSLFKKLRTQQYDELVRVPQVNYPSKVEGWLYVHDGEIPLSHRSKSHTPEVDWEPFFCVLNQLDQTFTFYRSEDMSIFPGTPTRPRTSYLFDRSSDLVRVRLDSGASSVKSLICDRKWGMNPVLEEEEEVGHGVSSEIGARDLSQRKNSSSSFFIPLPIHSEDTSYDKACGSERRNSAPHTPMLSTRVERERDTPSRFANFFSKRSFKSNPLKRTKSVTKLERKKVGSDTESNESSSGHKSICLRTSRSHESLLSWPSVSSFISSGMMSTVDLASGEIRVRPLHSSLLSPEFSFELRGGGGRTKVYSCPSAPERDGWVRAIRTAVRPYEDEVRRVESSLKLWVVEGKGIGSGGGKNKKYFCEVYLDDELIAITSAKPKTQMLFWGEQFEFSSLPNTVQDILVVLYREGERKKKRSICIGKVKIPVSSVSSRYLIEKWYPLALENSKDKDNKASLRVKCKFQSVDILPIKCYKPFLQYIKEEFGPVCESLEGVLSVKAKEDIASALVHVLHHEGLGKEFIAELALQEILKSGDEKLTFRGNSIATKAMEAFLKLAGTDYLTSTLSSFITTFLTEEENVEYEVDPMKLLNSSSTLAKNQNALLSAVTSVWSSILHSSTKFPPVLRDCFSHCREALKSAGRDELGDHLISASLFLRFLCPAILSPSLFNITSEYPSEKSARNLTLVAKVLQTLANFTRFQEKETYMEFLNEFIEREAPNMKKFLLLVSSQEEERFDSLRYGDRETTKKCEGSLIDLGKYSSILSSLLSESVGKIAVKNERFRRLQELIETINFSLSQPASVSNCTPFQFPPSSTPSSIKSAPPLPSHPHYYPPQPSHLPESPERLYAVHLNQNVKKVPPGAFAPAPSLLLPLRKVSPIGFRGGEPIAMRMGGGARPQVHPNALNRSGSQASSGYQSQSPVLPFIPNPLSFSNPGFSSIGNSGNRGVRSSSSSECEELSSCASGGAVQQVPYQSRGGKRRENVHKIYSNCSTDEDSDSGHVNDCEEEMPPLPPIRKNGAYKFPKSPASYEAGGEKSLEEYELEMLELRRVMEALQIKLSRAEDRLFGHESSSSSSSGVGRNSENEKEIQRLLQKFLIAEEEVKSEQNLLTALDKKQKLIEAQEVRISRLDAVNNQLISALGQIQVNLAQKQVKQEELRAKHLLNQSPGTDDTYSNVYGLPNGSRKSKAMLEEQALKVLAELKSSYC